MRTKGHIEHLGHLIPPGSLSPGVIERELIAAMDARRFMAGLGVPSVPTRYVVSMNPADRAWLDPTTEDALERSLAAHAERAGYLILGRIELTFRGDKRIPMGKPSVWIGFAEGDLLVLSNADAAADVFSASATPA